MIRQHPRSTRCPDTALFRSFILNPPYTLEPLLRETMPYLVKVLGKDAGANFVIERGTQVTGAAAARVGLGGTARQPVGKDRKSTRLNSSHANISYAVFCLKK